HERPKCATMLLCCAGRHGDVAGMPAKRRVNVGALETFDDLALGVPEGFAGGCRARRRRNGVGLQFWAAMIDDFARLIVNRIRSSVMSGISSSIRYPARQPLRTDTPVIQQAFYPDAGFVPAERITQEVRHSQLVEIVQPGGSKIAHQSQIGRASCREREKRA